LGTIPTAEQIVMFDKTTSFDENMQLVEMDHPVNVRWGLTGAAWQDHSHDLLGQELPLPSSC